MHMYEGCSKLTRQPHSLKRNDCLPNYFYAVGPQTPLEDDSIGQLHRKDALRDNFRVFLVFFLMEFYYKRTYGRTERDCDFDLYGDLS